MTHGQMEIPHMATNTARDSRIAMTNDQEAAPDFEVSPGFDSSSCKQRKLSSAPRETRGCRTSSLGQGWGRDADVTEYGNTPLASPAGMAGCSLRINAPF